MNVTLFAIPLFVLFVDRVTKWWALQFVCQAPLSVWGDYVSCMVTYNKGVSWSLLSNDTFCGFCMITALIVLTIGMLLWHTYGQYQQSQMIIGELMVLGGAISNLYDRFVYDGVVDFISLRYGDWAFPIFNVADIAIVCGVLIMLYDATIRR